MSVEDPNGEVWQRRYDYMSEVAPPAADDLPVSEGTYREAAEQIAAVAPGFDGWESVDIEIARGGVT